MFSSSLLEGFDADELKFVMGHELGHHVYDHHAVPIGYLLNGQQRPDPSLALELFAWSRYAEISADRAGAHCAQNMDAVARSLFKLASGLSSKVVEFSLNDFVAQVDDMSEVDQKPGQGAPQSDWFSTHPFSPLRVKALKLFERSELYAGAESKHSLEMGVQSLLSIMEPSYLDAKTEAAEAMRRVLFSGLIAVANATNGISDAEVEVFKNYFGQHAFSKKLDVDKTIKTLARRINELIVKASQTQQMQVLHDLCVMAKASGQVSIAERDVLDSIATAMSTGCVKTLKRLSGLAPVFSKKPIKSNTPSVVFSM